MLIYFCDEVLLGFQFHLTVKTFVANHKWDGNSCLGKH